ncbi:MAG: flavin reductase family protein [Litorivicinus sp.]
MFIAQEDLKRHFHYDPFKALIAPRPIGWISTRSANGQDNLAPYSFSNAICGAPPMLMFVSSGEKDSLVNARETRQFTYNLVSQSLMQQMSKTSAAVEVDEFDLAGLQRAAGHTVNCPYVAQAPAALECQVTQILQLTDKEQSLTDCWMVMGQVTGLHVQPALITPDRRFDTAQAELVARCGYKDYWIDGRLVELERG